MTPNNESLFNYKRGGFEIPTANLRLWDGVLQQRWVIGDPDAGTRKEEWRDVPEMKFKEMPT